MSPPDRASPTPASPAPRRGLQLMLLILLALAALSLYSNYQRAHRAQIEKITIAPAPSPEARTTPPPANEPNE